MIKYEDERAFPVTMQDGRGDSMTNLGMTLRDYFAAQAMQAMISTAGSPCLFGVEGCEPNTAEGAYKIADAMLAERAK